MIRHSLLVLFLSLFCYAQTETASIYGSITDPSGAVVPNATIRLIDTDRDIRTNLATDNSGFYTFASIRPGHYQIEVEKTGFKLVRLTAITVNVQDNLEENFKLALGSASESVTVVANAENLNTTDASVSTLIDNRFVENMPLNGRSFGSLLDLTPGVVLNATNFYDQGQFSVNGQRPDANYFMVDGVSANLGVMGNGTVDLGQSGAGELPSTGAGGGMNNLVSLDALQEFRVQTSTFAAEYGRTPGAQISVVTKSGTNAFHGTAFEYFRNDVLDAGNWFNGYMNNPPLPKGKDRQNDFGGVIGGPIVKDKLFFFGSYEGLRLRQPKVADTYVPSLASLQNAAPAVQPLLNAFPKPNGAPCPPPCEAGTAGFAAGYSDPSTLNSASIRADYALPRNITLFGRYSDAPSEIEQRAIPGTFNGAYSTIENVKYHTQTLTVGTNQAIGSHSSNEFRFNYSRSRAHQFDTVDNFGGAVPPSESVLFPFQPAATPQNSEFIFFGDYNTFGLKWAIGKLSDNLMQQFNVTDSLSRVIGTHQLKSGIDYRRLHPTVEGVPYQAQYVYQGIANIIANTAPYAFIDSATANVQLAFNNWSLFAQDTWNLFHKITLTYGLRWEYNGAPSSPNGTLPFTLNQVNNLATAQLSPQGTQLWSPEKHDFAPRLGIAWNARSNLVVRAGAGFFYDLGYSAIADGTSAYPYQLGKYVFGTKFPLDASDAMPPVYTPGSPASYIALVDPHHLLPRTYEWNAAVEQSLSRADVLTLTYVGAGGRKLTRKDFNLAPSSNPTFAPPGLVELMRNAATSDYSALQAQYRHRVSHGLQALLSYSWTHSIDDASSDANWLNTPLGVPSSERGSSDYDIRHTFSGAVSYDIPGPGEGLLKQVFGNWSTDTIIYARSSLPVNVVTGESFPGTLLGGQYSVQRPNIIPGVPFYLDQAGAPGGKIINGKAFCSTFPTPCPPFSGQGDLGRNALRGFGATQWDITARRQFRFTERYSLQFRGDFFNILNHPNFGNPINYLTAQSPTAFGYASQTLNNYLGTGGYTGGLNPLYQIGGPRSIQLALKLQF